jgi:predicted type IV restriction endonuclease
MNDNQKDKTITTIIIIATVFIFALLVSYVVTSRIQSNAISSTKDLKEVDISEDKIKDVCINNTAYIMIKNNGRNVITPKTDKTGSVLVCDGDDFNEFNLNTNSVATKTCINNNYYMFYKTFRDEHIVQMFDRGIPMKCYE